jgi:DNA-binding transcriptional LysR family regulator
MSAHPDPWFARQNLPRETTRNAIAADRRRGSTPLVIQAMDPLDDLTRGYDLVGLRYVHAIAACGSMTEAARRLRVSQPTLSVAVRDLEERLGTTLFLRGPKGVVATAAGQTLARTAEAVFAALRQGDEAVHEIESEPAGRYSVGCYHSFGSIFLPPMMRSLRRRAPRIELTLWEGTGPEVLTAVVDRTVHFGVDAGLGPRPHPELVIVPLFRDFMGVVVASKHASVRGPLFHVPRIPSSQRVVAALQASGRCEGGVVACGDLELVKSLVLHGVGVGALPWRVAMHGTPKGALRLVDPSLPHEVEVAAMFHRADLHRTRAANLVREEIVKRGRELDAVEMPLRIGRIGRRAAS